MKEYWRETLPPGEEDCYQRILSGVRRKNEEIDCKSASPETITRCYYAVYRDHPELFYMSSSHAIAQSEMRIMGLIPATVSTAVRCNYIYDDRQINTCNRIMEGIVKGLKNPPCSRKDMVLRCLEYIVQNTEYQINNHLNQNAAAALCFHKAQCSGISQALKYLLDGMGVPCILVEGEGRGNDGQFGPHAWTIVELEGKHYHVDATYLLGANPGRGLPLNWAYVFYDDRTMGKTHRWDPENLPKCTDGTLAGTLKTSIWQKVESVFREKPRQFASLYDLKQAVRAMAASRQKRLVFQMQLPEKDPQELQKMVNNACKMAFTAQKVPAMLKLSQEADGTMTLTAEYQ